jgi:hypothetical protein
MLISLFLMAIFLAAGNLAFWHFDPKQALWRRLLKVFLSLTITALAWRYFGRLGVFIWFTIVLLPLDRRAPRKIPCTPRLAST